MNDRTKESNAAKKLEEAKYGLFAGCTTLAIIGIGLIYSGIFPFIGTVFVLALPIAFWVYLMSKRKKTKHRNEQLKTHRAIRDN